MRHVAPLSPVSSLDCAYFPSPRGGCPPSPARLLAAHFLSPLCFHTLTNPFSRNLLCFTSIQIPRGYPQAILARRHRGRRMPEMNRLLMIGSAIVSALLCLSVATQAQIPPAESRPVIVVSGTVRNSAGNPFADPSVFFEEKSTAAS